jgi:para-nitrobenzyl esterase
MNLYVLTGLGEKIPEALLPRVLAAQLAGASSDAAGAAERLVAGYRELLAERGAPASPAELFYALQTDLGLRWPSLRLAELHAARQPRTYAYLFTWPSPLAGGALRACHALDLPFTFGTLGAPGMADFAGAGAEAERLSADLRAAWLAFAACGDPSHPGIGSWPAYAPPRRATFELGPVRRLLEDPFARERALWESSR